MVAPSALADTVTPPMVLPDGDLITPDRIASASAAGATIVMANAAARRTSACLVMASSPSMFHGHVRLRRHRLEISDDGVDLRRLELMLEARHVRGAVRDHLAQHIVASAGAVARQDGPDRRGGMQ